MPRSDIQLQDQLEKRKNWSDALVDAVVATVLYRQVSGDSPLDNLQFLVTERVRSAEKGQFQAHHGGFLKTSDADVYAGAIREVLEETGYEFSPDELKYIMSIGPAMYRSELSYDEKMWVVDLSLTISEEEAEPTAAFCLPIFVAEVVNHTPHSKTDGEVHNARWLSLRTIIEEFGIAGNWPYSKFNYFQILFPILIHLRSRWEAGERALYAPGTYTATLARR